MWENLVGRSLPFWRFFFPRCASTFPEALADVELEDWYREVNAVEPSLIRVEADEATYNLHIILRFELEQEMLADVVRARGAARGAGTSACGSTSASSRRTTRTGVLQDMHWASGAIGYFPTYALGNLISAQLWERVTAELPDLYDSSSPASSGRSRDWLRERLTARPEVHAARDSRARSPAAGRSTPEPYLRYLRARRTVYVRALRPS